MIFQGFPAGKVGAAIKAGAVALGVCGSLGLASAVAAQGQYAQVTGNDMSRCAPGKGPAVRVQLSGLRSSDGNLFVRVYHARGSDWLKSKRYLTRVDARPKRGSMSVCVPVPAAGRYAIAVQHDINGNRETDFSTDGAGMSNNPEIGSFLGIPRPPSASKAAFSAGSGVTRISVQVRYRN